MIMQENPAASWLNKKIESIASTNSNYLNTYVLEDFDPADVQEQIAKAYDEYQIYAAGIESWYHHTNEVFEGLTRIEQIKREALALCAKYLGYKIIKSPNLALINDEGSKLTVLMNVVKIYKNNQAYQLVNHDGPINGFELAIDLRTSQAGQSLRVSEKTYENVVNCHFTFNYSLDKCYEKKNLQIQINTSTQKMQLELRDSLIFLTLSNYPASQMNSAQWCDRLKKLPKKEPLTKWPWVLYDEQDAKENYGWVYNNCVLDLNKPIIDSGFEQSTMDLSTKVIVMRSSKLCDIQFHWEPVNVKDSAVHYVAQYHDEYQQLLSMLEPVDFYKARQSLLLKLNTIKNIQLDGHLIENNQNTQKVYVRTKGVFSWLTTVSGSDDSSYALVKKMGFIDEAWEGKANQASNKLITASNKTLAKHVARQGSFRLMQIRQQWLMELDQLLTSWEQEYCMRKMIKDAPQQGIILGL